MSLFGNFKRDGKLQINWGLSKKEEKKTSLYDEAKEIFGEDKKLMMFIQMFLKTCREKHRYPTRTAWKQQLAILNKFPEKERINQVDKSIKYGWNSLAYEEALEKQNVQNKVTRNKVDKSQLVDIEF